MKNPNVAYGRYINIFFACDDFSYDVFIIINEPNDEPDVKEVETIKSVVHSIALSKKVMSSNAFKKAIEKALNELDINTLKFGCQVLAERSNIKK